jgi:adenylyltransferase/sulfurtransferase
MPSHDHVPASTVLTDLGALTGASLHDDAEAPIRTVSATALKARLDAGEEVYLLDVRNPEEFEIAILAGAAKLPKPRIQLAYEDIKSGRRALADTVIADVPADREVVVYCRSGVRSADAIMMLRDLGFDAHKLANLEGGILAWAREVDTTMPVY